MQIIKRMLIHDLPAVPRISIPCIDVRDVAKAHVLAMTNLEAAGHRHFLVLQPCSWLTDIARDVASEFKSQGKRDYFGMVGKYSKNPS